MANTPNDLWPSFDNIESERPPVTILKEVAATLGPKTNNLVEAVVKVAVEEPQMFQYRLLLMASVLRYTYGLLTLAYEIGFWPARIKSEMLGEEWVEVANENELRDKLTQVLNHPRTNSLIRSMIAQSRAMAKV